MRQSLTSIAVLSAGLMASAVACSSSSTSSAPTTSAPPATTATTVGSGPVDVLFAGSLSNLMNKQVAPAFKRVTGYTFQGTSGDSGTLANEIKGKTVVADVFVSANPSKDQLLEGASNGSWVSWYARFATSPLVVGYNPNSKFASGFKSGPWYEAINHPGLLLGRTDGATDPKGALTLTALKTGAKTFGVPELATDATNASEVLPETSLVGRLQAGQLDAGFFYSVEAAAAGITYIPVTGVGSLQANYTVTIVNHAPDPAGAAAFVGYLLGHDGRQLLARAGITLQLPVAVTGTPPANIQAELSGG